MTTTWERDAPNQGREPEPFDGIRNRTSASRTLANELATALVAANIDLSKPLGRDGRLVIISCPPVNLS